ncbi:MAG: hypothetical protein INR70_42855 [Parafilimonas terrae]|nr:hypothetical protein [Parafilimonas terrae]
MAANAKRPGSGGKKGGFATRRSAETGAFMTYVAPGIEPEPRLRRRAPEPAKVADPNDKSPYLQELRKLGGMADRGETVDATGMSKEEFLKAFLGR